MASARVAEAIDYRLTNTSYGLETSDKTVVGAINELAGGIISDASEVAYNNATYTTVEAALNELLYVAPVISSFTNNVNSLEKGATLQSLTLN